LDLVGLGGDGGDVIFVSGLSLVGYSNLLDIF